GDDAPPEALANLVAEAVGALLGTEVAGVGRIEGDELVVVASWSRDPTTNVPPGHRVPIDQDSVMAAVLANDGPARVENAAALERSPYRARAAVPVRVEGFIWGVVGAACVRLDDLPADAGERLERFADIVALAVTNARSRARLAAEAASDPLTGLANHRT